ncbi:MAG: hypothetical protein AAFY60_14120, partial [Myxococcota bacterium]
FMEAYYRLSASGAESESKSVRSLIRLLTKTDTNDYWIGKKPWMTDKPTECAKRAVALVEQWVERFGFDAVNANADGDSVTREQFDNLMRFPS